jgi:hypothetical protein
MYYYIGIHRLTVGQFRGEKVFDRGDGTAHFWGGAVHPRADPLNGAGVSGQLRSDRAALLPAELAEENALQLRPVCIIKLNTIAI